MRIYLFLFLLYALLVQCTQAAEAQVEVEVFGPAKKAYQQYQRYQEPSITKRRFNHADLQPLIDRMAKPGMEVRTLGTSVEGRPIRMVRIGTGPVKVLLWSQMHGDESTATMAIMDLFRFFTAQDELDPFRKEITDNLSLYFIPMLNPDGAEVFQRRNALQIDLNRDALRLESPESKILKSIRDELSADWGFNLHDQAKYYTAGHSDASAAFSFLAPAYNYEKEVNEVRLRSMQLIAQLNDLIQFYLPGNVGKYDDSFEPRAFGDNIQRWGTSTILIECGGLIGDPEKQEIRKVHFALLLGAFESITKNAYRAKQTTDYFAIPDNEGQLFDLILRRVSVPKADRLYTMDLGFKSTEVEQQRKDGFYSVANLADLGDLSIFYGYEELEGEGLVVRPGKTAPKVYPNLSVFQSEDFRALHRQGYTNIALEVVPYAASSAHLPFRFHKAGRSAPDNTVDWGKNPSLILMSGKEVQYVVVNGRLYGVH